MRFQTPPHTIELEARRSHPSFRTRRAPAMLAVLAACGLVASCSGSTSDEPTADRAAAPLELSLGESDAMASCLPVEAATLAGMSPAFLGTVTDIEGETITLDIDNWYAGADPAEAVELHAEHGLEALIGGIDFQVGEQYLITAAEGNVNYCGYSGPADPALTAVFDEAFGT